jgi:integrase
VLTLRGTREEALFLLYMGTAIRKSEGLGLKWSEVDLDAATVTLVRGLHDVGQELGGIILVDDVKNDTSRRTLALPQFVVVALRRLQVRQQAERERALDKWHEQGLVFTTQFGTPISPRNINRSWDAALQQAGLPQLRLQDVRGSVGSLLLEDGEDIAVISQMKGHASITTTMRHYTQVRMLPKRRAADRLQRLLGDEGVADTGEAPLVLTPRRARRGLPAAAE